MKDVGIIHRSRRMKIMLMNPDNKLYIRNMNITYKCFTQEISLYLDICIVNFVASYTL